MVKIKKYFGFSLVELLVSLCILLFVIVASFSGQIGSLKTTQRSKDKVFATQKAIQIMEELRALVQGGGESSLETLDTKDDKSIFNPVLTTEYIKPPADITQDERGSTETSGNVRLSSLLNKWKFLRLVQVKRKGDDARAREVTVSVYYGDSSGNRVLPALATLSSVLRTDANVNIPSQSIDTFALAINTVPGWWGDMYSLKQYYVDSVNQLKFANGGLDFKNHMITRLAYGRDPYYAPFTNTTAPTETLAVNYPYFYPGYIKNIKQSPAKDEFYYPVIAMQSDGALLNVDDTIYNRFITGNNTQNMNAYSSADYYNNAVRYPEEINIHKKLKSYAKIYTGLEIEPTLRILWDDLTNGSGNYINAMITNLHGELLPMPPIRNYSDPAKDPKSSNYMYKRIVTHPEMLEYSPTTDSTQSSIKLRVYPYLTKPDDTTTGIDKIDVATVFIPTSQKVGTRQTGTDTYDYDDDSLPGFKVRPTYLDSTQLAALKSKINVTYINSNFNRISTNFCGNVTFQKKASASTSVTIPKGYTLTWAGGPSGLQNFVTMSNLIFPSGSATNSTFSVEACSTYNSSSSDRYVAPSALTGYTLPSTFMTNYTPITCSPLCSPASSANSVASTITSLISVPTAQVPGTLASEGTYTITINPIFDRDGDGYKEMSPGILFTLYNTSTKHAFVSGKGGLPTNRRLYGMEYIPTPLASAMPNNVVGTTTYNYPSTHTGATSSGTTYTTFSGRDLDNTSSTYTKNTARWIISIDVGDDTEICSLSNPLACFKTKMMAVETRLGNNLNTGMTMNQSFNSSDGIHDDTNARNNSGFYINDPDAVSCSECTTTSSNTDAGNSLSNLSRTYVWIDRNAPETEKYQFMGDPRHNPYLDVLQYRRINHYFGLLTTAAPTSSSEASLVSKATDWYPCFGILGATSTASKPNVNIDLWRFYQVFREGLQKSNAILNLLNGFDNYYFGVGGEIGTDDAGYIGNLDFKISEVPYGGASANFYNVRETDANTLSDIMDNASTKAGAKLVAKSDAGWTGLNWLGELYPDDKFYSTVSTDVTWLSKGNLPASGYIRKRYDAAFFKKVSFDNTSTTLIKISSDTTGKLIGSPGCAMFFNGGAGSTPNRSLSITHVGTAGDTGTLTATAGTNLALNYSLPLPATTTVNRKFYLGAATSSINMWSDPIVTAKGSALTYLDGTTAVSDNSAFYKVNSTYTASSLLKIKNSNLGTNNESIVSVSGFKAQGQEGSTFLTKYSLASILHAFFKGGNTSSSTTSDILYNRVVQIPRVEFSSTDTIPSTIVGTSPKEGAEVRVDTINLTWNTAWLRWDGKRYSQEYPDPSTTVWNEKEVTVKYHLTYKIGNTWRYIQDDSVVPNKLIINGEPKLLDTNDYSNSHTISCSGDCSAPSVSTPAVKNTFSWNISSLPDGKCIFRVDAFRYDKQRDVDMKLHSSYHQREIDIAS